MFKECWKDIYSYEGKYKISNYGRVYSVTNNKIMKPYPNKQGYLKINLNNKDGGHKYFIHKLVALHFIPNPGLRDSVNHIDGNPNNNEENTHRAIDDAKATLAVMRAMYKEKKDLESFIKSKNW